MDNVVEIIRSELLEKASESGRLSTQRFFKETIVTHGLKTPIVRSIATSYFRELKGCSKEEIFSYCTTLWKTGYMEEALIACTWSHQVKKLYIPEDFELFQQWVSNYVNNWATCDTLCCGAIATLIEKYPEKLPSFLVLAKSDNRWMRRAAAVSLVKPAKKALYLDYVMAIADIMLYDQDDLVQKGYGWMLKSASQAHPDAVFQYVMKHRESMPRTALRYAIEKMPEAWRREIMESS